MREIQLAEFVPHGVCLLLTVLVQKIFLVA